MYLSFGVLFLLRLQGSYRTGNFTDYMLDTYQYFLIEKLALCNCWINQDDFFYHWKCRNPGLFMIYCIFFYIYVYWILKIRWSMSFIKNVWKSNKISAKIFFYMNINWTQLLQFRFFKIMFSFYLYFCHLFL